MSNSTRLQNIIAKYNNIPASQINLANTIKDVYVAAAYKDSMANDICNEWPHINCTAMHNDLFETLKTGNDVIARIGS